MREARQEYARIDRSCGSFEHSADHDHPDDATMAHEAMLYVPPFAIPAEQARLNVEGLKRAKIPSKLRNCIPHHGERILPTRDAEGAGPHEPIQAANVGKGKIPAVVDVQIQIQVVRPDTQRNSRRGEYADSARGDEPKSDADQAQPRKHGNSLRQWRYAQCSKIGRRHAPRQITDQNLGNCG